MFKIGFNRAARIMDQLEEAGVVGPEEGTKPRKVLMSPEQFEQYQEEYLEDKGNTFTKTFYIYDGGIQMKTDIQIAQEAVMEPIAEVAERLGYPGG